MRMAIFTEGNGLKLVDMTDLSAVMAMRGTEW
jgi:hypothetical protein